MEKIIYILVGQYFALLHEYHLPRQPPQLR
jgi:hypothetical protein